MINNNYTFVLSSCDNYSDLWDPFFTQLRKYWTDFDYPVYICTESKSFKFNGIDIHCPLQVAKTNTWSQNLLEILDYTDTEFVIFMLDDFWLKSPVNTSLLEKCKFIIEQEKNMGFLCLIQQKASVYACDINHEEIVHMPKNQYFRITTQAGIWRKKYLQQILRKHESAWQFEWFGSKRSKRLKMQPYVVSNKVGSVFDYDSGGVLFRGAYVKEYIGYFLDHENISLTKDRKVAPKSELESNEYDKKINYFSLRFIFDYIRSMI